MKFIERAEKRKSIRGVRPGTTLTCGHPNGDGREQIRKFPEEVIRYEHG